MAQANDKENGLPAASITDANLSTGNASLETGGSSIAISKAISKHDHVVLVVGRQATTADIRIQHKSLSILTVSGE